MSPERCILLYVNCQSKKGLGSRGELQTQLLLAKDFDYLTEEEIEPVFNELEEIGKMLYSLSKSL